MRSSWFRFWILGPAVCLACTTGRDRTAPQPAIHDFRATPERIDLGETVTLEARYSQGAGKIEPEPGELVGPGKLQVKPRATTRYLLTVTGPSGAKVSRELTVTVGPALAINIHGLDGAAGHRPQPHQYRIFKDAPFDPSTFKMTPLW